MSGRGNSRHHTTNNDGSKTVYGVKDGDSSTYYWSPSGSLLQVVTNPGAYTPGGTLDKPTYTSPPARK